MQVLVNGEQAYPAMIQAIDAAIETIGFASYIFNHCPVGLEFVDAFRRPINRGIEVRVLVDSTGSRYSRPSISKALKASQIPCARFLPFSAIKRPLTLNLHKHRKLLIVDGRVGFAGGMSIRQGHFINGKSKHRVQDLHFSFEGPSQLIFRKCLMMTGFSVMVRNAAGKNGFLPLSIKERLLLAVFQTVPMRI